MGKIFLITGDTYSKYIEISKLPILQESVIKVLKENFSSYGIPKILFTILKNQMVLNFH